MNEIIQSSVYTTQKGTPVTDSVKVAQVFGKMHKNIMKSIRNILGSAKNGLFGSIDCKEILEREFKIKF